MFVWQHCRDPIKFEEILQMVEPYEEERKMILNCIQHDIVYQSYIAVDASDFVVAIVIATILPKTQTLHIEDFALHPNIQKQGHARQLWKDWRDFINKTWTKIESLTIEVYLQNVEPWRKIMDVHELLPEPLCLLPLAHHVPVMFMGKNITNSVTDILNEWKQVQTDVLKLFI
jgi:GNAT superfamily N-acetyltransferase